MTRERNIQIDENPNDGQTVFIDENQPSKGECPDIRDLSEKEQKSPIAWKWALREISKLNKVESEYNNIKDKYAGLDKEFEVYKANSHQSIVAEIVSSSMLAIGPALLGFIPSVGNCDADGCTKLFFAIIGCVLIIFSIIIKIFSYNKRS